MYDFPKTHYTGHIAHSTLSSLPLLYTLDNYCKEVPRPSDNYEMAYTQQVAICQQELNTT